MRLEANQVIKPSKINNLKLAPQSENLFTLKKLRAIKYFFSIRSTPQKMLEIPYFIQIY